MTNEILVVVVSEATLQRIGPKPTQWMRLVLVDDPGASKASVIWRRQEDRTAWVIKTVHKTPAVRWLHTDTAGVDSLPLARLEERAILISNARGAYTSAVSEWALGAVLLASKRLDVVTRNSDAIKWSPHAESRELEGSTIVIFGLGSIGQALAKPCSALGMRVVGVTRSPRDVQSCNSLPHVHTLLSSADGWRSALLDTSYLVISTPLTEKTSGIIDSSVFNHLNDHSWLINVARGEIVREHDLISALDGNRIAGAILDTVTTEPLDETSELWGRSNVIISPHMASLSNKGRQRTQDLFFREAARYRDGEKPINLVSYRRGY